MLELAFSILLVLLGALAVYPAMIQTWPGTKQWLDKAVPYQGGLGIVMAIWGLLYGLHLLGVAGVMMHFAPIVWLVGLMGAVVAVLLGLLMGYSVIERYILRHNSQVQQRGEVYRAKLLARQASLGWGAIVLGVVFFLMRLVA